MSNQMVAAALIFAACVVFFGVSALWYWAAGRRLRRIERDRDPLLRSTGQGYRGGP